jgi:hypothetical protein
MHHALQALPHADRPGHRCALDAEHALHLVQQIDRLLAFAVQLVDEGHDRRVAQAAHLHQLDRPLFHALGHVDDHQRRVDRRQHAVGVLAEVGVARCVEQIDDLAFVRELHHRRGDRDAAFLFQRHPVGRGMPGRLAALDRTGHLDRAAEQQQLFGQRGLAGVRMGNDGEGAAARSFGSDFGHGVTRPPGALLKELSRRLYRAATVGGSGATPPAPDRPLHARSAARPAGPRSGPESSAAACPR